MRRNRLPAIQGLVRTFTSKFAGPDKNQTKVLMSTHSGNSERLRSVGNKPRYFDAQFLLGITRKNL